MEVSKAEHVADGCRGVSVGLELLKASVTQYKAAIEAAEVTDSQSCGGIQRCWGG